MVLGPLYPVRPPILEPPAVSLLQAARKRDEEDERWGNGVAFAPFACTPGRTGVYDPCNLSYVKSVAPQTGDVEFLPIAVFGADQCSTIGWRIRDYVERAELALYASESFYYAAELWTSPTVNNTSLTTNPNLTTVAGGPYAPADALMLIENRLAATTTGQRAMIHMRPGVLGALVEAKVARRVGNLWLDYMDNVLVADAGYPGTGPSGQSASNGNEWMFASGIVEIIRGPVHHFPDVPEQEINRTVNQVDVFVDRIAVVMFDPCISATVNVLTPGTIAPVAIE